MKQKMKQRTRNLIVEAGKRLEIMRNSYGHSRQEMASRIGISRSNLYKNEIGFAFPRLDTLIRLHEDFDLSLDWLLFNSGSMHTKENQAAPAAMEKQTESTVNESPEIKELLAAVQEDLVLRHELLAYFYKYKKNQVSREHA
ncbi:MAG: Helix-turn-helix protein [Acidobacteriota bacterium]|nr:Helix-turn-helix protein [Acidobacteriota bacterium]